MKIGRKVMKAVAADMLREAARALRERDHLVAQVQELQAYNTKVLDRARTAELELAACEGAREGEARRAERAEASLSALEALVPLLQARDTLPAPPDGEANGRTSRSCTCYRDGRCEGTCELCKSWAAVESADRHEVSQ